MSKDIRKETYFSRELAEEVEDAAEKADMSVSKLLREGARRQVQAMNENHEEHRLAGADNTQPDDAGDIEDTL